LLGNNHSSINNFKEAQNCYSNALECKGNDSNSILYNSVIAYGRAKNNKKFQEQIEKISLQELNDEKCYELLFLVASEKINFLIKNNNFDSAIELSEKYLKIEIDKYEYRTEYSKLLSAYSGALWKLHNKKLANKYLNEAIELDKSNEKAMWLIREIDNLSSKSAKHFHVLILGIWPEPFEGESIEPGFFSNYQVVAENIEQALGFIKRFEPTKLHKSIKIEEYEILENCPEEPLAQLCELKTNYLQ
jgi:tetratricopeptide (TPR) repeat protein